MSQQRLNKLLVKLNLAPSRRKADELIQQGRVSVNGKIQNQLGSMAIISDDIKLDGKAGVMKDEIYIAYNKPKGLVCSHTKQGNKTISDNLPNSFSTLKMAGRLDKDSQGLMILSSDGEFVNKITHPSQQKTKSYTVVTKQELQSSDIEKINQGIKLDDGISKMRAKSINANTIGITMAEGKNRQIRRTLNALGKDVIKLERTKINKYSVKGIAEGKYEFIKPGDVL